MQLKRQTHLMTFFLSLLVILFGVSPILAQTQPVPPIHDLYAFGGSYNFSAQPNVAGTALYGHLIVNPGTYFFSVLDIVPSMKAPFTVTSNIGVGVAQKMFSIGKVDLVLPTTAGVSWTGSNVGWQWNGGLAFIIHVKDNFYLIPTARYIDSTVSNGSGYQPIIGIEIGIGK